MKRLTLISAAAALLLAACGGSKEGSGAQGAMAGYAENITVKTDAKKDAALYAYFCQNTFAAACPNDIDDRLSEFRVDTEETRLALADAFTRLRAAADNPSADGVISDQAYVRAAYQVVLGREPDEGGGKENLAFVERTGDRTAMLRSLLTSDEFKSK